MTDNEIIKGLECCGRESCNGCPYNKNCHQGNPMIGDALDLIKRQQEEIEGLKGIPVSPPKDPMDFCGVLCDYAEELIDKAKSEAYREFAEMLNDRIVNFPSEYPIENATLAFLNGSSHRQLEILEIIDKLLKEYEKGRQGNEFI